MPPTAIGTPSDLRQRILEAAEQLIETEGLSALSMREVARRSGVTHQAPYHHFQDREAILAELVVRGFDELKTRLAGANERRQGEGPLEASIASGLAYVGYAIEHPGIFRIMFRPELCDLTRFPQAQASGTTAYQELEHLVAAIHGPDQMASLAQVYWAQVHGLACLIVDGPMGAQIEGAEARRHLARSVLEPFARGMLSIPRTGP